MPTHHFPNCHSSFIWRNVEGKVKNRHNHDVLLSRMCRGVLELAPGMDSLLAYWSVCLTDLCHCFFADPDLHTPPPSLHPCTEALLEELGCGCRSLVSLGGQKSRPGSCVC